RQLLRSEARKALESVLRSRLSRMKRWHLLATSTKMSHPAVTVGFWGRSRPGTFWRCTRARNRRRGLSLPQREYRPVNDRTQARQARQASITVVTVPVAARATAVLLVSASRLQ